MIIEEMINKTLDIAEIVYASSVSFRGKKTMITIKNVTIDTGIKKLKSNALLIQFDLSDL